MKNTFAKSTLLSLLFFVSILNAFSQKENTALLKKTYNKAEDFLNKYQYNEALPVYLSIDSLMPENSNINFKIGYCYLNSRNDKLKSIPYFEKASKNASDSYKENNYAEINAPIVTSLYLGQAYLLNYEFDRAVEAFKIFKLYLEPTDTDLIKEVERYIENCNNGKDLIKAPIDVTIKNLGDKINSQYPDYSPLVNGDESALFFTSRRPGSTGGKLAPDGLYYEDIYVSSRLNEWEKAKGISANINTPLQEATAGMSFDGQTLFIYKGEGNFGTLYKSELKGKNWSIPELLDPYQETSDWQTHGTLTADREILYFVSDMPEGFGGKDIWMSKKLPTGDWGLPINLGPEVNSEFDEEAPFIHPDGKYLFFSSKGHKNMGGFDIFFVEQDKDSKWANRVNIGYPINTPDDDVFFVTSADGRRCYFSSNRSGGFGDQDIYMATMENFIEKPLTVLSGCIKLSNREDVLSKIEINVKNIDTDEEFLYRPNSASGRYIMALNIGNYNISFEYDGVEFHNEDVFVTEWIYSVLNKEIELNLVQINDDCLDPENMLAKKKPAKKDESATQKSVKETGTKETKTKVVKEKLNLVESSKPYGSVSFEFGTDKLNKQSAEYVAELAKLLKENKNSSVELSGYTDSIGKPQYNVQLSKRRSLAVKSALVNKGVSKNQVSAKWYGPDSPIASNETEEGRAKNRRVEILLIEKKEVK